MSPAALLEHGVEGYGYLHKVRVGDVEQLVRAIREVAAGGSVLDPRIVEQLLAQCSRKPGSPLVELTPAELDVLRLMARGSGTSRSLTRSSCRSGRSRSASRRSSRSSASRPRAS